MRRRSSPSSSPGRCWCRRGEERPRFPARLGFLPVTTVWLATTLVGALLGVLRLVMPLGRLEIVAVVMLPFPSILGD